MLHQIITPQLLFESLTKTFLQASEADVKIMIKTIIMPEKKVHLVPELAHLTGDYFS